MKTRSVTDYLQALKDIEAAIQFGILPPSIGTVYHKFAGAIAIPDSTQKIISVCENENPFNDAGIALYISSSNASDTQEIYIEGIDTNYQAITATVSLNGQTAVLIPTFRTIWRAYNNNSTDLQGTVYVGTAASPTNGVPSTNNQYAAIPGTANNKLVNQSLTSIFTIPEGYTGFITRWYGVSDKGDDVDFTMYRRSQGKVWRYIDRLQVYQNSFSKEMPYLKFNEMDDLKIMGISSKNTSNGSITYDLIILNNEYLNKTRLLAWR